MSNSAVKISKQLARQIDSVTADLTVAKRDIQRLDRIDCIDTLSIVARSIEKLIADIRSTLPPIMRAEKL